jgi:hypothetical protein
MRWIERRTARIGTTKSQRRIQVYDGEVEAQKKAVFVHAFQRPVIHFETMVPRDIGDRKIRLLEK